MFNYFSDVSDFYQNYIPNSSKSCNFNNYNADIKNTVEKYSNLPKKLL